MEIVNVQATNVEVRKVYYEQRSGKEAIMLDDSLIFVGNSHWDAYLNVTKHIGLYDPNKDQYPHMHPGGELHQRVKHGWYYSNNVDHHVYGWDYLYGA